MLDQKVTDKLPTKEWVYIIAMGKRGVVKIGVSTNVEQRLAELQSISVEVLSLLAAFSGGRNLERRLHQLFADQRIRNELFRCDHLLWGFLEDINYKPLAAAIARVEEMKAWFQRPARERRAIERRRRETERKVGIIPIYPDDWNEARLEANRRRQKGGD